MMAPEPPEVRRAHVLLVVFGDFHSLLTHPSRGGGGGGVKSPIHFRCILHANMGGGGGGVPIACAIAYIFYFMTKKGNFCDFLYFFF